MSNYYNKAVVIGLDGTPFTLLKALSEKGIMPNTKKIIEEGSLFQMNASIPEISSVSWSCFMTGKNPAKHGIFGFTDLKPYSYSLKFPNFNDLKSETIWEYLFRIDKKRSVILNIPATYPAKEMHGVLVSGFVAIELDKAVYPKEIAGRLRDMNYELDVDLHLAQTSMEELMDNIFDTLNKRDKAIEYFWEEEKWDLFIGAITGTDRLHHFFWNAWEEENSFHERFLEYYKNVDDILWKYYNRLPSDAIFMMLSDHGFTGIIYEIYLNNLLVEKDVLKFGPGDNDLSKIYPSSRAFVMDPGRIYINLKSRYPSGSVNDGAEYEDVINHITEILCAFEIEGVKPVDRIVRAIDIYNGPLVDLGPDLIVFSKYGYDLKGTLFEKGIYGKRQFTGMHTFDDAFFLINKNVNIEKKPDILDISPTVISALNYEIPADIDGISLL